MVWGITGCDDGFQNKYDLSLETPRIFKRFKNSLIIFEKHIICANLKKKRKPTTLVKTGTEHPEDPFNMFWQS